MDTSGSSSVAKRAKEDDHIDFKGVKRWIEMTKPRVKGSNSHIPTESDIFRLKDQDTACIDTLLDTPLFKLAKDLSWTSKFKYELVIAILRHDSFKCCDQKVWSILEVETGLSRSLNHTSIKSVGSELLRYMLNVIPAEDRLDFIVRFVTEIKGNLVKQQNFVKYWLPVCSKLDQSIVENLYVRLGSIVDHNDDLLYVKLSLIRGLRQSGKLNLYVENFDDFVSQHLVPTFSADDEIRGEAFGVLCSEHKLSNLPKKIELKSILFFLAANANTDSTLLRRNIIFYFETFLLRIRCSVLRTMKVDTNPDETLEHVMKFFEDLSQLVISGLEPTCNYQRKVLALSIYKLVLSYFLRGDRTRKSNLKDKGKIFVKFVGPRWTFTSKERCIALIRCLMDQCVEIKDLAANLLMTYFRGFVSEHKDLFTEFKKLSNDRMFYKRDTGVRLFQIIVVADVTLICENAELPEYGIKCLELETNDLQNDILKSCLTHPLDSTIQVLDFILTDKRSPIYELEHLEQYVASALHMVQNIATHLTDALSSHGVKTCAPSFEEMAKALNNIIKSSSLDETLWLGSNQVKYRDPCKLTPLQQILLNYIWITLKSCSKFASNVVRSRHSSMSEEELIQAASIPVKILKHCRHKGAIESAAVAMSQIVEIFTREKICNDWLQELLTEMLNSIYGESTISRCSAGWPLLVQSIVAGDVKRDNSFLELCWAGLCNIVSKADYKNIPKNTHKELPETKALHFLKMLAADVRMRSYLDDFLEDALILCLSTISSPVWTIRNASLQFFGVLLPKLVGQSSSQEDSTIMKLYEEVFQTKPKLKQFIIEQLVEAVSFDESHRLTSHSNLVPTLIIFTKICLGSMSLTDKKEILIFRNYFLLLLESEVYFTRKLAGVAFVHMHSKNETAGIVDMLKTSIVEFIKGGKFGRISNENGLHGHLLTLLYLREYQPSSILYDLPLLTTTDVRRISPLNLSLLLKCNLVSNPLYYATSMALNDKQHYLIGYPDFVETVIEGIWTHNFDFTVFREILSSASEDVFIICLSVLTRHLCEMKNVHVEMIFSVFLKRWKELTTTHSTVEKHFMNFLVKIPETTRDLFFEKDSNVKNIVKSLLKKINNAERYVLRMPIERLPNDALHFLAIYGLLARCRQFDHKIVCSKNSPVVDPTDQGFFVLHPHEKYKRKVAKMLVYFSEIVDLKMLTYEQKERLWLVLVDLLQSEDSKIRSLCVMAAKNVFSKAGCLSFPCCLSANTALIYCFDPNFLISFTFNCRYQVTETLKNMLLPRHIQYMYTFYETDVVTANFNPFNREESSSYAEKSKILFYTYSALKTGFYVHTFIKSIKRKYSKTDATDNCVMISDTLYAEQKVEFLKTLLCLSIFGTTCVSILEHDDYFKFSQYMAGDEVLIKILKEPLNSDTFS